MLETFNIWIDFDQSCACHQDYSRSAGSGASRFQFKRNEIKSLEAFVPDIPIRANSSHGLVWLGRVACKRKPQPVWWTIRRRTEILDSDGGATGSFFKGGNPVDFAQYFMEILDAFLDTDFSCNSNAPMA